MVIDPGNNLNSANIAAGKARSAPATKSTNNTEVSDTPPDTSDNVSLSISGMTLAQVEANLANSPDVDAAKVAVIKEAIANGSYKINPDKIAASILAQEGLLP